MIGQIIMFGGDFAPEGWAFCDGQLLAIASHSALFSILGTAYGGDGHTTFGLPDLRGRIPLNPRTGPGLPTYRRGQKGGTTQVSITTANMPSHNHNVELRAGPIDATSHNPNGNVLGSSDTYEPSPGVGNLVNMSKDSISESNVGGSLPLQIENPYLGVNFIIALIGIYPSRS